MLGSAPSGHRDLVGLSFNLCSFSHDNLCRFSTNRSSKTTQMFYLMDTGSRVRSQYIENQTRCRCEDHPDVTHVRDAGRRGPGRVHQGPGQEVLHKPGGILEGARIKPDDTSGGFIPSQERELSTGGGISRDETSYRQRQLSSPCGRRECYCWGDAIDGPRPGAVLERLLGGRDFRPQSAHHHRTHQRRAADRSTETRVHFR